MMIAVGGLKGGSGKTTVATNLAIMRALAGRSVLLVDADRQGTATDFWRLRKEHSGGHAGYTTLQILGRAVQPETRQLASTYDDLIIDTNGQDADGQRGALLVVDVLLVPVAPRSFDFWTLDRVAEGVRETLPFNPGLRACTFLNRADPRGAANDEAAGILRESDLLELLPARLVSRKAYANAAARGLAVTELQPPDPKAAEEIEALYACVFRESQAAAAR